MPPSQTPSQPSEKALRAVKAIWSAVSQVDSTGKKYLLFANRKDLVYLYCTGFVDETRYPLHDWEAAFQESLQPDGSYRMTEEQWMDKAKFRYCGPVGRPFEPLLIKEGDWPESDMERLIRTLILPAVYFSEKEFRSIFDEAKPTFFANGIYKITREVKEDLKKMVELYPSPAQVRALGLAEARTEMSNKGSGFSAGPAQSQVAAQRLSDLLNRSGGKG